LRRSPNEDDCNKRTKILPYDPSIDQLSEEWRNVTHMVAENPWIIKYLCCYRMTDLIVNPGVVIACRRLKKKRVVKCRPPSVDANSAEYSSP
jgi:hypothetical protein